MGRHVVTIEPRKSVYKTNYRGSKHVPVLISTFIPKTAEWCFTHKRWEMGGTIR